MRNSSADFVTLVIRVNDKLKTIVGQLFARRGSTGATKEAEEAMKTARILLHRYSAGVYQHDEREAGRIVYLANWLKEKHCELQAQPFSPFTPDQAAFIAKQPLSAAFDNLLETAFAVGES